MPRVCKAVFIAKCGYFRKTKIYLDWFNTWFHVCFIIVLISSLLFYNVENS
jgi:hypothetical protein